MRAVLAYQGYLIEEAVDGEDAVQKYRDAGEGIDLVMMDMNMPKMSGKDALFALRQVNPNLKAFLLSGGLPDQHWADQKQVRFLQKPFVNEELIQAVSDMLKEP